MSLAVSARVASGGSRPDEGREGSALVRAVARRGRGFASVAARQPERGRAQQLEQQQQLQRTWAAPWDPAVRVEVDAKFASMPIRSPLHTLTVNFMSDMWGMFHLIRFIWQAKGLFTRVSGHMAHNRAHKPQREPVIPM